MVVVPGAVVVVGPVVVVVGTLVLVVAAVVVGSGGGGGDGLVLEREGDVVVGDGALVREFCRGAGVEVVERAVTGERRSVVVVARRAVGAFGSARLGGSAVVDGSVRAGPTAVPCGREVSPPRVLTTPAPSRAMVAIAAAADTIAVSGRRRPAGLSVEPVATTADRRCCDRRWRARPSRTGWRDGGGDGGGEVSGVPGGYQRPSRPRIDPAGG